MEMNNLSNISSQDEENDLFYFESDHLALKGNKDYCDVLKTIVILCAQREKALKDYDKVVEIRRRCLENPAETLEKIQNGQDLGIPASIEIPKLPLINFDKWGVKVSEADLKLIYSDIHEEIEENKNVKPSNTNLRSWTPDEQKRLEELLVIYPPEPVEIKRFQKIADALGNRSVQQVTSRVQKYFIKLYKAGLPIPGRVPKSVERYRRSHAHKHQRYNHYLWKPSTFFPDLYVPVKMDDQDDNTPGPSFSSTTSSPASASSCVSQNYLLPTGYNQAEEEPVKNETEKQLKLLKRVREEKAKEEELGQTNVFQHVGYKCDFCDMEPLKGARWHCISCYHSVDFCTDCVLSQMYSSKPHHLNHTLIIFNNDTENPIVPSSDTESLTGSGATVKNYQSDSNSSGDDSSTSVFEGFPPISAVNNTSMKTEPDD